MAPTFIQKFLRLLRRARWCILAGLPAMAHAQFTDTFDTLNPAWTTDRYAPAAFQVVSFQGDDRLQITIDQSGSTLNRPAPADSAEFFNTQGDQRAGGILGGWSLSAEVYVSSAVNTSDGQLVKTDLWAHTGTTANDGAYAIFGFTNDSPTDPLNPGAPDRAFRFQIFAGTSNDPSNWVDAGVPGGFAFDAWHNLEITSTGSSVEYLLDGLEIYNDPTFAGDNLQNAYIQAYNFGQTDGNGLNTYSVFWDNAIAAAVVPEPSSFAPAIGLAALVLAWSRVGIERRVG